ncbi:hypothetical protein F2Q69_00034672 [Brassica cretica]|uniref:Uncharacterized protein n=1 Tax=Brassica cretica TaxID=69181 RepID=A0A8S9SSF8_BRACR|nr:hypothetical protein F2Q69_00034672 [Brassica cretica]
MLIWLIDVELEMVRNKFKGYGIHGEESGLDLVNEVLEEEINKLDDDVVEQDKYNVGVDLNGINEVAEEDFQNLTDGEFEEDTRAHEEVTDIVDEGKILDEAKGQDRVTGDILKKQGARKRFFKPSVSTGGSTKMRLVQAGRKGTLAKSGIRQGEGTKQTEDKGTSNPKLGPAKTSIDFMDHIITVTMLWEQWLAYGFCFLKVLFCFGLEPSLILKTVDIPSREFHPVQMVRIKFKGYSIHGKLIWRGDCYYLKSLPSAAFQVELAKTQAEPSEDNAGVDFSGNNEVAEEDFQNHTDGEFEEDTRAHEEVTDFVEEGKILDEAKGQDRVTGDILKKQGARKRFFKPSVSTGGSTKMWLVQAGRKGTLAKSGIRQGEGTKQTEDKGTSNPKPGPAKTSIDFMDHIITVTTLWEQWLASGFCFLKVLFCFGLEPSFCLTGLFLNKIGSFGYYVTDGMKFSRRNIYCLEDQWYNLADTAFGLIKPSAVPDRMVRYKVHNRIRETIRFPLDSRSWVPFETGGSLEKMSSDYNQHADRRRWSVVLPSSDIVAVGLWGYNFSGYH